MTTISIPNTSRSRRPRWLPCVERLDARTLLAAGVAALRVPAPVSEVGAAGEVRAAATPSGPVYPAFSTVALHVDPSPSAPGQAVTITSGVSLALPPVHYVDGGTNLTPTGPPTGTVTLTVDGAVIGQETLHTVDGKTEVTFTKTLTTAGEHAITAAYSGDFEYQSSSETVSQPVSAPLNSSGTTVGTTLALFPTPQYPVTGQSVTLKAVVLTYGGAGTPTGAVTFMIAGRAVSPAGLTPLDGASSEAIITTNFMTAGTHTISASYAGGAGFAGSSTGDLSLTVNPAGAKTPTTLSVFTPEPVLAGYPVTLHASVFPEYSGAPSAPISGTVRFVVDGVPRAPAAVDATGGASLSLPAMPARPHSVTASFSGNHLLAASTGAFQFPVSKLPTVTTLAVSPDPARARQPVRLVVNVSPGPLPPSGGGPSGGARTPRYGGSVTLKDGTRTLGVARVDRGGHAVFRTASLAPGRHILTVAYGGDPAHDGSTSRAATETVLPPQAPSG